MNEQTIEHDEDPEFAKAKDLGDRLLNVLRTWMQEQSNQKQPINAVTVIRTLVYLWSAAIHPLDHSNRTSVLGVTCRLMSDTLAELEQAEMQEMAQAAQQGKTD